MPLYPQQNAHRNLFDLSGLWSFQLDPQDIGEKNGWFRALPAPRSIAVPASWNEQFEDTRDYLGVAWYLRRIVVPPAWRGQKIMLRFGSATYAAKVWTDYILSQRGQKLIGSDVELFSIRNDVDAEYTAASLNKQLGSNVKPIPVSAEIVTYLDQKKRLEFLSNWKAALTGTK